MTLEWIDGDRLWVVQGSPAAVRAVLLGDEPLDVAGLAVRDADTGVWLTLPIGGLAGLRLALGAGFALPDVFEDARIAPATVVSTVPSGRPAVPTIAIVDGSVAGAWMPRWQRRAGGDEGVRNAYKVAIPGRELDFAYDIGQAAAVDPPPDEPPSGPEPEAAIERTPHMDAPDRLPAEGESFTVRIYTDTAPLRDEEHGERIVIEAPPDVVELDLGVLLTASPGLEVDAPFFLGLTIHRHEPDGEGVTFTVRVTGDAPADEVGLTAELFHRGRPSGHVARRWKGGVAQSLGPEVPAATVHSDAAAPDLTLVVSAPVPDGIHYNFTVLPSRVPGFATAQTIAWALPEIARDFLKSKLGTFVDRTSPTSRRKSALLDAGLKFFTALPPLYQDALWAVLDLQDAEPDAPVRTVFIRSDEPLLPWELMRPTRPVDGVAQDRRLPLGVEVALGRWVRSDTTPPPQRLQVDRSLLIAAVNSKPARRLDSTDEADVLQRLYAGERTPTATLDSLDDYLSRHSAAVLHFVCHGAAQAFDDAIYLDEDEECTSGDVRVTEGFAMACGRARPLVFLNACDAGQVASAIGGGAGFPRVFTDLGARAVIAPLWPVAQTVAARAAVQLYEAAAAAGPQRTLADLLRDVRRRTYEEQPFEDSFASYCFFGDPCARLERVVAES
jgi:hypothetical protein